MSEFTEYNNPIVFTANTGTNALLTLSVRIEPYVKNTEDIFHHESENFIDEIGMHSLVMFRKYSETQPKLKYGVRALTIPQVNFILAKEMNEISKVSRGIEDTVKLALSLGRQWILAGSCLTPSYPQSFYSEMAGTVREIALQKSGQMDCENIWKNTLSVGDSGWLCLKLVLVDDREPLKYRVSKCGEKEVVFHENCKIIPQFVGVVTKDRFVGQSGFSMGVQQYKDMPELTTTAYYVGTCCGNTRFESKRFRRTAGMDPFDNGGGISVISDAREILNQPKVHMIFGIL